MPRHIITDPRKIREAIHNQVLQAVRSKFPVVGRLYTAKLLDLRVKFDVLSHSAQRELLTSKRNASDGVYADIEIINNETGQPVVTLKNKLILNIPYYTNRYTLMLDGNEYLVVNQMRTKSGVYTRKRGNDELESSFNLAKGANFKLIMQPETGIFKVSILGSTLLASALLKILGASPADMAHYIGQQLAEKNLANLTTNQLDRARNTLYQKLVAHGGRENEKLLTSEEKVERIRNYFANTSLDPETTKLTLGSSHSSVGALTILEAMKKILAVFKGTEDVDERDQIEFQKIHSVEDLLAEVIAKSRDIDLKLRQRLDKFNGKPENAGKVFQADAFTTPVRKFITGSSLSRIPAQINPMEFIDSASIVTRHGE